MMTINGKKYMSATEMWKSGLGKEFSSTAASWQVMVRVHCKDAREFMANREYFYSDKKVRDIMTKHKERVAASMAERTKKARAAALAKHSKAEKPEQVTGERMEPGSGRRIVHAVEVIEMMSNVQIDTARTADDVGELACGMDDIISRMEAADAKLERIMAGMRAAGFEIPNTPEVPA